MTPRFRTLWTFAAPLGWLALASCSAEDTSGKASMDTAGARSSMEETAMDAPAKAELGQPAPGFTLVDLEGKTHRLADYRGKTVVLEWFNPLCPFVVYAHEEGILADMSDRWADDDVVWLAINSGAPGQQGTGAELNKQYTTKWNMEHPLLLDESGTVGRAYEAKTTPHMYVIDSKGILLYRGGLDNAPRGQVRGGGQRVDYVEAALASVKAGESVAKAESEPYGCSVKYVN